MPLQNHLPERREISREHFLYPQVLRECEGVTTPAVWPEEAADGWRCTCGCENAPDKIACAACGVGLDWLREHFNRSYLAGQQAANEQQRAADRIEARTREKRRTARRRTVRLGVILAAAAAVRGNSTAVDGYSATCSITATANTCTTGSTSSCYNSAIDDYSATCIGITATNACII